LSLLQRDSFCLIESILVNTYCAGFIFEINVQKTSNIISVSLLFSLIENTLKNYYDHSSKKMNVKDLQILLNDLYILNLDSLSEKDYYNNLGVIFFLAEKFFNPKRIVSKKFNKFMLYTRKWVNFKEFVMPRVCYLFKCLSFIMI